MAKGIVTEEQVIQHIRTHMDIWCKNYGSHVLEKHVNVPEKTLLSRIGTTENNHFIKTVSSFYDETDGQQIMDLLQRALESEAKYIAKWCNYSKRAWLGLNFYGLPDGITAKACRYDALNQVFPVSRFVIFLSKREQYPFYLENAYPVFDQD